MTDVFEVADLLVSHAVASHGDDVDLVAYYGSRAQGAAGPDSDLDLFYVPRDGTNPPIARTVLLEGRLFDFWGIRWETLEGFATGRIRGFAFAPALVHHATPLHVRGEAQARRLEEVKALVAECRSQDSRPRMLARAFEARREPLVALGEVRLAAADGNVSGVRWASWRVVQAAIECLALLNQTFFDRGVEVALGQLDRLEHRPAGLAERIATIAASAEPAEVARAAEAIALGTVRILDRLQRESRTESPSVEPFSGAYPELRDMVRKVLAACDRGDGPAAGIGAWLLQSEVRSTLGGAEIGLPDLLAPSSALPAALAQATRAFHGRLRSWLTERGVDLQEYDSLEELRRSL